MPDTQPTGRTRPYTYPELLRLVAHVLTQPGVRLREPSVMAPDIDVDGLTATTCYRLSLGEGAISDLLAWARVMAAIGNELKVIKSFEFDRGVLVFAIGRLHHIWVTVSVNIQGGLPVDLPSHRSCQITLDELAALAAAADPVPAEQLVGVR
jgi:hypothetical protein